MANDPKFEIPDSMRQLAEKNLEQTRAAYDKMMDATKKAQAMAQQSSDAVADSMQDLQAKALKYAEQSMETSFSYANELVNASDFQEAMKVQQEYARKQMESYQKQAQEMSKLVSSMTQSAQGSATGAGKSGSKSAGRKK